MLTEPYGIQENLARAGLTTIEGNSIYFEVAGQGPAIVWLHDGLLHRVGFDGQFDFFAKEFTVVRYDRPGYGDSPPPISSYSDVGSLASLFDHLGLSPAILVGGSAGGRLALDFSILHPDRVQALVLIGAVVRGIEFSDHMLNRGWRNAWPQVESDWLDFWANDPWLVAEENGPARARLRKLLSAYPQNLMTFPVPRTDDLQALPRLPNIQVPVLVMVGEADIADNHAHAGIIQVCVPGAERQVVPHAGHLVYFEQPEQFNQRVLDFLTRRLKTQTP